MHDSSEERFLLTLLLFVGWHILLIDETGRIVSITAQVARGFPGMVHTGAARAGVEVRTAICAATLCPFLTDEPVQNMTMTLSVEWSPYNINVCEAKIAACLCTSVLMHVSSCPGECCCSRRDWRLRNASLCQGGRGGSHRKDPPQEAWKSGGSGLSGHLSCLPHGFLHHRPNVRSPTGPLFLSPPCPFLRPTPTCNGRYRIDGGQSLWGDLLNPHAMARL